MSDELTAEIRNKVVEQVAGLLVEQYAFPETAERMAARLRENSMQGAYDGIVRPSELGSRLTADLRAVGEDRHLAVYYHPQEAAVLAEQEERDDPDEDTSGHWWTQVNYPNYGIQRAEYLTGNVGYLDLRCFAPVSLAGDTVVATMRFLAQSNALIFDLRQNGGGDPFTVQLFESYLFDDKPKHFLTLYERPDDWRHEIWKMPYLPGKRLPDLPVYILTSGRTCSGGEDFSYTLKHLGRATVVGESTAGAAHTVEFKALHAGFVLALPTGYPRHAVTQGNWEGTGVEPDIAVPREEALRTAHIHALDTLIEGANDEAQVRVLRWDRERVEAIYAAHSVEEAVLSRYVGRYGNWVVSLRDGSLFMSRQGRRDDWRMVPLSEDRFIVDELYNARFDLSQDGSVPNLVFLCRDHDRESAIPRSEV